MWDNNNKNNNKTTTKQQQQNNNKTTTTTTTTTKKKKQQQKKKKKKTTTKQQQNQKKNKEKTTNNNQKKVRKYHIFRRHTGCVSDTCIQSCFGLSFQKHTVGLFYTAVSKMRKSENRNIDIFETVSKQKAFKRRLTRI